MKCTAILFITVGALAACDADENPNRVVGELASDRIELTTEFNEPIVKLAFAEGDSVTTGQLLVQLNDARAKARLAEAEGGYLQAKARLDELVRGPRQERIRAARADVEGASRDLDFRKGEMTRIKELHARGLSSVDLLDKANAGLDAARANSKLRRAQLEELLAGTTIEELAQAEQFLKQMEARRDAAQIEVSRHAIESPVNGVVDSRLFELGERPAAGQPVVVLLAARQPHARVYVPESLRVTIRAGGDARVFVDGLETPVAGKVRWVASEPAFTPYYALTERDRGRLSYVAKIDLVEERDRLPDGVPVEVEFVPD